MKPWRFEAEDFFNTWIGIDDVELEEDNDMSEACDHLESLLKEKHQVKESLKDLLVLCEMHNLENVTVVKKARKLIK